MVFFFYRFNAPQITVKDSIGKGKVNFVKFKENYLKYDKNLRGILESGVNKSGPGLSRVKIELLNFVC